MRKLLITVLLLNTFVFSIVAQENKESGYKFTIVKELPHTSVKDQYKTSTCWSFASSSLIESELLRIGKPEVDLSEMYLVNRCYSDKADHYVRMQGNTNFAPGGLLHDFTYVMKNYGLIPESIYPGLNYGEKKHIHNEMDAVLRNFVEAVVLNKNRKITPSWKEALQYITDSYLGEIPEKFDYQGKQYTPMTFASEFCKGIDPNDYIEITSFDHHPFYQQFILEVPDNWLWEKMYNVPVNDMIEIIDNAVENGYTVGWSADTSEKGYVTSQKGIAVVPEVNKAEMTDNEISKWEKLSMTEKNNELYKFDKPVSEKVITQEVRQSAFDSQETTDDHAMHLVGIVKDQNGKTFYKIKNSWGSYNSFDGYFYASVPYIQYKTTAIMVHKEAIPKDIRKKLGL